jgi:hypothetical protein
MAAALYPLHVPAPRPLHIVGHDYMTHLPMSNGFDIVLIVVDHMTRMAHFMPCTKNVAILFLRGGYRLHGPPCCILVSDCDSEFVSGFNKHVATPWNTSEHVFQWTPGDGCSNGACEQYISVASSLLISPHKDTKLGRVGRRGREEGDRDATGGTNRPTECAVAEANNRVDDHARPHGIWD